MKRVIVTIILLYTTTAWSMSEEAQKIGAQFAAMKAKTHQTLTAAKDVTPLIERIDKDLSVLTDQKQQLIRAKRDLIAKKQDMQQVVGEKSNEFNQLHAQYTATNANLQFQVELLNAIVAQRSIQCEAQALAPASSRATLLAHVFSLKSVPLTRGVPLVEDVCG